MGKKHSCPRIFHRLTRVLCSRNYFEAPKYSLKPSKYNWVRCLRCDYGWKSKADYTFELDYHPEGCSTLYGEKIPSRVHELKIWVGYFDKIMSGKKLIEFRLGDLDLQNGDVIWYREWDNDKGDYTHRQMYKIIRSVESTKPLPFWKQAELKKHGVKAMIFEELEE